MGDVMSSKIIDDINKSVADKLQSFRCKNAQISMPGEIKPYSDSIIEKRNCYNAELEQVKLEANANQEGGQLRSIDSPQNMPVPTVFMQNVHRSQNKHKQTMEQKRTEVEQCRESIKSRKKKKDEDIRRLYDSLVREFQERRAVSS